jgi:hypothetical protein
MSSELLQLEEIKERRAAEIPNKKVRNLHISPNIIRIKNRK